MSRKSAGMNPSFDAKPQNHPKPPHGTKQGVLLVNLGTPDATDYWSMRRYLKEFLSDRRVIDVNRVVWWFVLNVIILTKRPFSSGHAYAKIWDRKRDASPLRVITEDQAAKLQKALGKEAVVRFAMRYGKPAMKEVLDEMMRAGCARIKVVPLYPQYAGATVGTVVDVVADWLKVQKWQPAVEVVPPYYDDKVYVRAVAESIKAQVKKLGWVPEVVVASFHGLPLRYCLEGDVYYCHSHKTARLVAEELGWVFARTTEEIRNQKSEVRKKAPALLLTFQSRFGREEWLQPYTDKALEELARAGLKKVMVVCPGFAADCVETLEEIGIQGKETFRAAGGTHYALVPCLNDSKRGMDVIEKIVK
ncbi:MAG: ferrochelatase [Proteobacteria bacterium]|nr:ferrochelatase [Pseudomonadota bacterium]